MSALGTRLAVFAALAGFAALHWVGLVADPPVARAVLAVALATAGGAALAALGRRRPSRLAAAASAIAASVAITIVGLVVLGLEVRLLLPGQWSELAAGLGDGLTGLGDVNYPYGGDNPWSRLALVLGLAPALGLAAALAFWPSRRAPLLRIAGLAMLVAVYATAVVVRGPDAELARGMVLVALVAAWLWLPGLSRREARTGTALVAVAGVGALPLAAQLDPSDPWLDYRSWARSAAGASTFNWDHSYGPLDWPRNGETLLEIKSKKPRYWKATVLERFDGFRWESSPPEGTEPPGIPERSLSEDYGGRDVVPSSESADIGFEVRDLKSEVVVGAGTTQRVTGIDTDQNSDGTIFAADEPLEEGDSYAVQAYDPDPSPDEMRAAPERYPPSLARFTTIQLPPPPKDFPGGTEHLEDPPLVTVPLRGTPDTGTEDAVRLVRQSQYGPMYRKARRLAGDEPTAYDAADAIARHLQANYTYSEGPPNDQYALHSFLFEDRIGYCQQFSGAMALMLRMMGIPARVAAGFAPGTKDRERGVYEVSDLDAHSWVEVYFTGIGWVPFDPTPSTAPAAAQSSDLTSQAATLNTGSGSNDEPPQRESTPLARENPEPETPVAAASGGGSAVPLPIAAGALAILLAAGSALAAAILRRRPQSPAGAAEARLRELESALERFGWRLPGGTTLVDLERRLQRLAGRPAGRYVAKLRAGRYAPGPPPTTTDEERRAARRALAMARGRRARLKGLLAMPPWGPRR